MYHKTLSLGLSSCVSRVPSSARTVHPAAAAGLDPAGRGAGHVRQQPAERSHHFRRSRPAELLVGPQRLCGHAVRHPVSPPAATEQVLRRAFDIFLFCRILYILILILDVISLHCCFFCTNASQQVPCVCVTGDAYVASNWSTVFFGMTSNTHTNTLKLASISNTISKVSFNF